jgi:C1A family cysteine protease
MSQIARKFGWRRDVPDQRDELAKAITLSATDLPPFVDFSQELPPVWDQSDLGSCTA